MHTRVPLGSLQQLRPGTHPAAAPLKKKPDSKNLGPARPGPGPSVYWRLSLTDVLGARADAAH